ncbi:RDD family protein [Bowmanella sp. JS7-9]|uniref:RDD family protein n=1 Tax=Pseudobowmanella zhangzhouensis TaxID=1537679 RepID=A0ABW1XMA9_9ALTE|nr:RDD family protein [Bowmanella sp. JS7-9]TBX22096.1 RDD domain containing protein [Bowmanella sp. JS7-9]
MTNFPRATLIRRLAAMLYDTLVAIAIGMVAALAILLVFMVLFQNGQLDTQGHTHLSDWLKSSPLYTHLVQCWVLFWVCVFFMWFWRNGGQTIGMRAWRLRILSTTEQPITYPRVALRMLCALGGLGNLLLLIDWKNRLSLQDRIANTEVVFLSEQANHHRSWRGLNG